MDPGERWYQQYCCTAIAPLSGIRCEGNQASSGGELSRSLKDREASAASPVERVFVFISLGDPEPPQTDASTGQERGCFLYPVLAAVGSKLDQQGEQDWTGSFEIRGCLFRVRRVAPHQVFQSPALASRPSPSTCGPRSGRKGYSVLSSAHSGGWDGSSRI
jgi:hypothetical protein